jgi:hypothetical protein
MPALSPSTASSSRYESAAEGSVDEPPCAQCFSGARARKRTGGRGRLARAPHGRRSRSATGGGTLALRPRGHEKRREPATPEVREPTAGCTQGCESAAFHAVLRQSGDHLLAKASAVGRQLYQPAGILGAHEAHKLMEVGVGERFERALRLAAARGRPAGSGRACAPRGGRRTAARVRRSRRVPILVAELAATVAGRRERAEVDLQGIVGAVRHCSRPRKRKPSTLTGSPSDSSSTSENSERRVASISSVRGSSRANAPTLWYSVT